MLATAFAPTIERPLSVPAIGGRAVRAEPVDALAARFAHSPLRPLDAKEHLFCEGDRASHVYRVEAGHICVYRTLPDGRRQVIDFAYPGDVIGLGAIGEHGANAQATVKTLVRALPIALLNEMAEADPRLGNQLYTALSFELMAARELLFTVSQRTATERVASFLLGLSRRNARRGEKPDEIVLPMTRSDIADFLGLTIETVSRMFTRLRVDGLIDVEHCILVTIRDRAALEAMAMGGAGKH